MVSERRDLCIRVCVCANMCLMRARFMIELSKSEDALRPFVLACETKQVKLVTIAIGCIQKLISFHAIPEVGLHNVVE